ncbi:MAG: hypothetical protein A2252_04665 [Elusimicrobia bacterium RIFOXYA2_FULL_39_19]|nr:MAG: hypothetical protein A2252_04665 [Elusimicrobia bacterium RIFOXYA2_FULL_39_19]
MAINNNFEFYLPTKIVFGKGSINKLTREIKPGEKQVLLVTGRSAIRSSGLLARLENILKDKTVTLFDKVYPEPDIDIVDEGVKVARANNCSVVVGVGGGSVIDVAKAIASMCRQENFVSVADYMEVDGTKQLQIPGIPFIAVPTTSGTGSEVTKNSVLINKKLGTKRSLRSDLILARTALVDPELTLSLNKNLTAEPGMDALTHILEAYAAKNSSSFTDVMAREGIELVKSSLLKAVKNPDDYEAREKMSMASLYGGILLANAGLGLVHAIAPFVSVMYNVSHGLAVAVLLPHVLEYNAVECKDKLTPGLIAQVKEIAQELGIPKGISVFGVKKQDLPELARKSLTSVSVKNNPRNIDIDGMLELLSKCF